MKEAHQAEPQNLNH